MTGRRVLRLSVLALLLGLSTGCDESVRYPAPDADLRGPITSIASGFTVVDGSALLGPLWVHRLDSSGQPASWTAYVVVAGDPLEVWDAYLRQVETLGLVTVPDAARGMGCYAYATGLSCGNFLPLDQVSYDQWVEVGLVRLLDDPKGRSLIKLVVTGLDERPEPGRWSAESFDEHPRGVAPEVPAPSPPPGIGDRLGPGTTVPSEEFTLLRGTRLVAQVGPGGGTGGLEVLLAVALGANPQELALRYDEQCEAAMGGELSDSPIVEYGGMTQRTIARNNPGIGYCEVVVSDRGFGIDYILLSRFND